MSVQDDLIDVTNKARAAAHKFNPNRIYKNN